MTSWKVSQLTRVLRSYDRHLYAVKLPNGLVQVRRKAERQEQTAFGLIDAPTMISDHLILSLTDDWKPNGNPVDRGIEPVMEMIRGMDAWHDDSYFGRMLDRRDAEKNDRDRQQKNHIRAIAADGRKDFAKATNDYVVTS